MRVVLNMTIERVCSSCFDDKDLRDWIRKINGPRGCDVCGKFDSPTCDISEVSGYIETCLRKYWGFAVAQLPYISSEGGYQGRTWDTAEVLFDGVGLSLPRDTGARLYHALLQHIVDETWCEYDWLTLDPDEALRSSWERFCATIKHCRRFFFHSHGEDDRDSYTPVSLLETIARISQEMGLIRELRAGLKLWRARPDIGKSKRANASDFGPPPPNLALQSNRMNPPGIPMLYLASSTVTALKETRTEEGRIGLWKTMRPLLVLDLRNLPVIPGIFSNAEREHRLALRFLHRFAQDIMTPVARDQRVHIDYLPSQVVTEFFRDLSIGKRSLDGIAYGSTVHPVGWNLALFASPVDLGLEKAVWGLAPTPWLKFLGSKRVRIRK